ncbi:MAG: hypothetical protein Q9222_001412 [Ikaeria aurantiellina]
MTETFHLRLFLLLHFFCLSAIPLVSSRALPAKSLGGPNLPPLSLPNQTITQNIQALVDILTTDPNIQYSNSAMVTCELAVEFYEHGDEPHDLYHSSHISDFHDIKCAFRYGGFIEDDKHSFFFVQTKFPDHWDQWSLPAPFRIDRPDLMPSSFTWSEVQTHVSVERADQLLKAAGHQPTKGFIGTYDMVHLEKTAAGDLAWCFNNVIGDYPDTSAQHDYLVHVTTGRVEQTPHCGIYLDAASRSR